MRTGRLLARGAALLVAAAATAAAPRAGAQEPRYGETPPELVPFAGAGEAYRRFFDEPPQFRGPGRELPEPPGLVEVRIGVLAPLEGPEAALGARILAGVELAIAQANAAGGYRGRLPFVAVPRNESPAWGAAASAAVRMLDEDGVWAVLGAFDDANTHVMSRVLLKIELPVVNTGGFDPTLTEHAVPWMVRMRPDDRQNGYALARRIFQEEGLERVAVFRSNDRYGRVGTGEFVDAARRLHRPVLLELRFLAEQSAWPVEIERLRAARPQAIVIWGRPAQAGRVVRALREAGLEAPLYGPDPLADPAFLAEAGAAAEGMTLAHPFDPARRGEAWTAFHSAFLAASGREPDEVAAYAYEGARYLLGAIEEAGLNRPLIRDRLFEREVPVDAVVPLRFDLNRNNTAAVRLARIDGGRLRYLE